MARAPSAGRRRLSLHSPLLLVAVTLAVACGSAATPTPTIVGSPPDGNVPAATNDSLAESVVLASGQFVLPAAGAFGAPGFHEVLRAEAQVPTDVASLAGSRLVLRLRDLSRPAVTCDSQHPLSGCATVDWSDFPGRPGVPEGGAFENRVTLPLASGSRTFYLRVRRADRYPGALFARLTAHRGGRVRPSVVGYAAGGALPRERHRPALGHDQVRIPRSHDRLGDRSAVTLACRHPEVIEKN